MGGGVKKVKRTLPCLCAAAEFSLPRLKRFKGKRTWVVIRPVHGAVEALCAEDKTHRAPLLCLETDTLPRIWDGPRVIKDRPLIGTSHDIPDHE